MQSLAQAIDVAVTLDDDELYKRIGAVASKFETNATATLGRVQPVDDFLREQLTKESLVDLLPIGRKFVEKVNAEARELLCGEDDSYKDERQEIWGKVGGGAGAVGNAIALFLISTGVGVPAGIVVFVCSLFAKMLVKSGADTLCDAWTAPA